MIKELVKLASNLDGKGLRKEADYLDKIILKLSEEKMEADYLDKIITNAAEESSREGSIAFDMEELFGPEFDLPDDLSLSEAPTDFRLDLESKLKTVLDPNDDHIVTLEELINGLEKTLGISPGSFGTVTSKGWEDVNWELLTMLINPIKKALQNPFEHIDYTRPRDPGFEPPHWKKETE